MLMLIHFLTGNKLEDLNVPYVNKYYLSYSCQLDLVNH